MNDLTVIENGLIPIYQNENGERLVDARELHEFLEVKSKFADWIKNRIDKYGFIENLDYVTVSKILENGGRTKEYILKLDTAKELAMVENNSKGRLIRRYFIEVEKKFRQQVIDVSKLSPEMQMFKQIFDAVAKTQLEQQMLKEEIASAKAELDTVKHRIDNIDNVNLIGDLRQRLNAMVRKYAREKGINYGKAWNEFKKAFNTAYHTNLELCMTYTKKKYGLKDITIPQYLSIESLLEDAIRVADKMLNN